MPDNKKWFNKANKFKLNGIEYASRGEAEFSLILDKLLAEGRISNWRAHPSFPLQNFKKQNTMKYTPDFLVTTNSGQDICIEIKSGGKAAITEAANVRMAYFVHAYPHLPFILIRSSGRDKFNLRELLAYL